MYRSSPFRSTLNTGYITCLGMCKVCTEAVHSVALWTRVTLRWDMCKVCTDAVHSVALWTRVTLRWDMCKVCTEAVHSVALWTRVTLRWDMCEVCTEAVHSVALWTCVPMQGTLSSPPPQPTPHHPSCVAFNMCGKNMPIPRGRKYVVSINNVAILMS